MKSLFRKAAALSVFALLLSACGGQSASSSGLSGVVKIDGSSTVFPITEAVAEEFQPRFRGVRVPVGVSGTGGGFKKWVKGETDINNSSRPIKKSELDEAQKHGIELWAEIPVAYDGLSVVVPRTNTWLTCVTTAQLKQIWDKGSTVKRWNEVNPAWPAEEIRLYGPGTDSGTFDYFTEFINGKSGQSRSDFTASEDDHVLVEGVAGSKNGFGYFGYAFYADASKKVRAVAVDGGKGCVEPSDQTIQDLTYPLARYIYIHPSKKAMERPEVVAFIRFYLQNALELVAEVGYTPLLKQTYDEWLAKLPK